MGCVHVCKGPTFPWRIWSAHVTLSKNQLQETHPLQIPLHHLDL